MEHKNLQILPSEFHDDEYRATILSNNKTQLEAFGDGTSEEESNVITRIHEMYSVSISKTESFLRSIERVFMPYAEIGFELAQIKHKVRRQTQTQNSSASHDIHLWLHPSGGITDRSRQVIEASYKKGSLEGLSNGLRRRFEEVDFDLLARLSADVRNALGATSTETPGYVRMATASVDLLAKLWTSTRRREYNELLIIDLENLLLLVEHQEKTRIAGPSDHDIEVAMKSGLGAFELKPSNVLERAELQFQLVMALRAKYQYGGRSEDIVGCIRNAKTAMGILPESTAIKYAVNFALILRASFHHNHSLDDLERGIDCLELTLGLCDLFEDTDQVQFSVKSKLSLFLSDRYIAKKKKDDLVRAIMLARDVYKGPPDATNADTITSMNLGITASLAINIHRNCALSEE